MKNSALIILAALLISCSGDSGSKSGDDAGTDGGGLSDMGSDGGITPDVGDEPDVHLVDAASDTGTDATTISDATMTTDAATDVGADDVGVDMAEPEPPLPITWPATPDDYAASARVSYIATLRLPELDENDRPTCCRDFGARSRDPGIDNSLAILRSSLAGFDFDLNELLENTLSSGDLVALLDHRELDGSDDPDGFVLVWLRGFFEGATDYAAAAAGNGTYTLDSDSLHPNGEPKLVFNPAQMQGGAMSAGPAALNLLLPIALSTLDLTVDQASIAGDATIATDDVSYAQGTMSGYVELDAIFENLNLIVSEQCQCLGLQGELFTRDGDGDWTGMCIEDPGALCQDEMCTTLAGANLNAGGACSLTQQLLPQLADIDLDGDDSRYEAISLGLEWTGVPGRVVGAQ